MCAIALLGEMGPISLVLVDRLRYAGRRGLVYIYSRHESGLARVNKNRLELMKRAKSGEVGARVLGLAWF